MPCRARGDWRVRRPSSATVAPVAAALIAAPPKRHKTSRAYPHCTSLHVEILHPGSSSGALPRTDDVVHVHYATLFAHTGRLADTSRAKQMTAEKSKPMVFVVGAGSVVPGFETGIQQLTIGGLARIHVPSHLAYGAEGCCGSVPPHTDLIFEVELVRLNASGVGGLRTPLLRRLLMLPVSIERAGEGTGRGGATDDVTVHHNPAAAAVMAANAAAVAAEASPSKANASLYLSDPEDGEEEVEVAVATGERGEEEDERRWPWIARLRPKIAPPVEECRSFFALMEAFSRDEWKAALRRRTDGSDGAQELLPGSVPIRRESYGFKFDSRTPMVLTGERHAWPCFRWGWRFWAGPPYGDSLATAKQRAPIFDSDLTTDNAVAEASVAEYIEYARHVHERPLAEQRTTTNLYMNGWELFHEHPSLWRLEMAKLAGAGDAQSIDNLTASEYERILVSMGNPAESISEERVMEHTRRLNKLFLSPRGAITRMHQDNHHAHAWLSQVRGRKLYVLCAPQDYALVAPRGRSADENGTTRQALFDPLDAAQRSERMARGLKVYATVLQAGETIVCPDSWWHYAVSLSPSLTHMCNFWDAKNRAGLRDMVMKDATPSPPERPLERGPQRLQPRPGAGVVVLRELPNDGASAEGGLRPGEAATFDVQCGGYVRTAQPLPGSASRGWAKASSLVVALT